jgi:hypothetical protein
MNFAGSSSERFANPSSEAQARPPQETALGITAPMPPLPTAGIAPAPRPERVPSAPPPAAASVFRINQDRLAALQDLTWRRARVVLWVLVVGVALGLLLLIPAVHQLPPPPAHPATGTPTVTHPSTTQRPFWAFLLLMISVGAPLLALAVGVLALPVLLWRAAWLRRQRDLHLAIGRQGLLFFLPGQMGRWFLLPWGHITALTDVTTTPRNGRRARLRTVLWRRWARLQRAFRHGHRLGKASAARSPVHSPFLLPVWAAGPHQRLRVACYGRLPDSGYSWLFTLAPFTRRVGSTTFLLESGWFESATGQPAVSLHRVLLGLWASSLAREQRAFLPLPRARGAVMLNTAAPVQEAGAEARRVDGPAWAALPLVPALSVSAVLIALFTHQPLAAGDTLNLATLGILTLGLGLLLAGTPQRERALAVTGSPHAGNSRRRSRWALARPRWLTRGRLFVGGAFLLALAGALNVAYAIVALLREWPWAIQVAPSEPFFFLELLASLLLILGGTALGLEGSGRPGEHSAVQRAEVELSARLHSTELAVALGLLALGVARVLGDIDLAALSRSALALQWLRDALAEPLLPLAIIGLSYFALLAGPSLQSLFRVLQAIYGLVLAQFVPAAFIFVYRTTGGKRPLPLEWLPLLVLELVCGLLVVILILLSRRREQSGP